MKKIKLPYITSHSKYPEGYCEVSVMARTKKDGLVLYHYLISSGYQLSAILRSKFLTKTAWVWMQKEGRLTHKDILGEDGNVIDTKHYEQK